MAAQAGGITARLGSGARIARRGLAFALVLSVAVACSPIYRDHGYVPADDELALLTVGEDTRDSVALTIGRPSAGALLGEEGWYYVQSRYRQVGPRAPQEIERQLVAITFDEAGTVTNIERFGLQDGRVVTLSRRVTDTNIKGASFIRQLLQNFGRVRAGDFLGSTE
jgi:outer membrane protein assembly factor BamE (lipoprotein component of BamABCDE complex)